MIDIFWDEKPIKEIIEYNGTQYFNYLSMTCQYNKCQKPIVENTDINGKSYCKRHYNKILGLDKPLSKKALKSLKDSINIEHLGDKQ